MSIYESVRAVLPISSRSRPIDLVEWARVYLRTWRKRARDRAELASLSDRGLRDIAADKSTVQLEVRRAFWQKPLM